MSALKLHAVAVVIASTLAGGFARAQGVGEVSGQLRILEKAGESSADLGNAVVYLEPVQRARVPVKGTTSRIAMQSRQFTPRVRVVPMGSRIEFPNEDPFSHNIFSNAPGATFDLGVSRRGQSRTTTFPREGVFPVFCNIHPRMTAFVVAVSTPYFTQPDASGRFTIPDVTPGRYVIHFWHERAPLQKRTIDVPAGNLRGVQAELDGRGFIFVPHMNKFGQEYTGGDRDRY